MNIQTNLLITNVSGKLLVEVEDNMIKLLTIDISDTEAILDTYIKKLVSLGISDITKASFKLFDYNDVVNEYGHDFYLTFHAVTKDKLVNNSKYKFLSINDLKSRLNDLDIYQGKIARLYILNPFK